ncbi:MAG: tyrosine--tRNA ligase [Cyanobacteriota bacterium]
MDKYLKQAEFIARGTEILPNGVQELAKKLKDSEEKNTPLRVKLGMDPTKPDLHLGHTVVMRKLKQYQDIGHTVVLIIGDATAMIGDPSGKSETRKSLTKEEVDINAETYLDQMNRVLDITKAEVLRNADWLHKLNFSELLKLAAKCTVAQMLARDDFSKRYSEGKPISIHELFYPLMQAYDSVEIKSDIELGGTDQRFNVLLGREIQTAYGINPQIVQLLPLLEGTDGIIKMSKTYPEHCISLTDEPKDMYGKTMSIPDTLIIRYFELLTDLSNDQLNKYKIELESNEVNPRDYKMALARTIVSQYYSIEKSKESEEAFVNLFSKKQIPDEMPEFVTKDGQLLSDLLVEIKFVASKGEVKRLIKAGGIKVNSEKITDINYILEFKDKNEIIIQVGKRKFAKIKL